jgi:alkylated DNA repair protein alkB homolog 6
MADKDAVAIDFAQLLREEKRRARQQTEVDHKLQQMQQERTQGLEVRAPSPVWNDTFNLETFPIFDPTKHRVSKLIDTVCYIPRFLSNQTSLLQWLDGLPENTTKSALPVTSAQGRWTTMTYGKRRVALFINQLPPPLQQLANILVERGIFPQSESPNHILVNEYQTGQGILPHTDGPAYVARTATLSLGHSDVLLKFVPRLRTEDIGRVCVDTAEEVQLEGDGSLVVFSHDAYSNYTHGIEDCTTEVASDKCVNAETGTVINRGRRISLTFRHALQVL